MARWELALCINKASVRCNIRRSVQECSEAASSLLPKLRAWIDGLLTSPKTRANADEQIKNCSKLLATHEWFAISATDLLNY